MSNRVQLHRGVKSDPIEDRYSWESLLRILPDESVGFVQIGAFFEIYRFPDSALLKMRERAEQFQIQITSVFTARRELGGSFRDDPAWVEVAFQTFNVSSVLVHF